MLTVNVVSLFPEVLAPFLGASIPGRAAAAGKVAFRLVQLRDFTHDRHRTVDDTAFGGGAGMVLKAEPILEAVESLGMTAIESDAELARLAAGRAHCIIIEEAQRLVPRPIVQDEWR